MFCKTQSGSIYEIDQENKRIRRVTGEGKPTERVGEDGVWKQYHDINVDAKGIAITWYIEEGGPDGFPVFKMTVTSPVVQILARLEGSA